MWSIAPEMHALSCHLLIDDLFISEGMGIVNKVNELLKRRFNVRPTTMQLECESCEPNQLYCFLQHLQEDEA